AGVRVLRWPVGEWPGSRAPEILSGRTLQDAVGKLRASMQPNIGSLSGLRQADGDGPLVPSSVALGLAAMAWHGGHDWEGALRWLRSHGVGAVVSRQSLPL